MLREIGEQGDAIRETVRRHVTGNVIFAGALDPIADLAVPRKIVIAASGSSRHAGLVGEIMMEDLAGVEVEVEYASEYCNRSVDSESNSLVLLITQSGETADTIAAQREAGKRGAETVAISNVAGSTIGRAANATLLTYAGPERAVPCYQKFHNSTHGSLPALSISSAETRAYEFRNGRLASGAFIADTPGD